MIKACFCLSPWITAKSTDKWNACIWPRIGNSASLRILRFSHQCEGIRNGSVLYSCQDSNHGKAQTSYGRQSCNHSVHSSSPSSCSFPAMLDASSSGERIQEVRREYVEQYQALPTRIIATTKSTAPSNRLPIITKISSLSEKENWNCTANSQDAMAAPKPHSKAWSKQKMKETEEKGRTT